MVRVEGLEPPRLAALEPKSSASTNFAIPANYVAAPKSRHIPKLSNKARPRMRVENEVLERILTVIKIAFSGVAVRTVHPCARRFTGQDSVDVQ